MFDDSGHARLLLVALDRTGVADRGLVGIELELLARVALAKQVPAIAVDLQLSESLVAGFPGVSRQLIARALSVPPQREAALAGGSAESGLAALFPFGASQLSLSAKIRVMSDYCAQAHLDAPLDEVWALVGNPATYPQWWPVAVEIRGETFEVGDVYTQVLGKFAGRRLEYTRIIDRRDELKELKWSCPTTGGFQRWLLTAAQGGTFVEMEMGLHPPALRYRLFDKSVGRWFIKRWAEQAIDGLRQTLASARSPEVHSQAQAPGVETPPPPG